MDSCWTENLSAPYKDVIFSYSNMFYYQNEQDAVDLANYYIISLLEDFDNFRVTKYFYDENDYEVAITATDNNHNNTVKVFLEGILLKSPRYREYSVQYIQTVHKKIFVSYTKN